MSTAINQPQRPETADLMPPIQPKAEPQLERIPISKARSRIGQLVNRVHTDKDRIVLEKSGIPVAALIDFEEFKQFLAFRETVEAK